MSLEIVDLDESSNDYEMKQKPPIRTFGDLPYLRKDYIQLMKPLHEKISMQQIQIDHGNEQIQILLRQLGTILAERTRLFRRIAEIKGFFNDKQNKRYRPANMTKKEAKTKLDKCDSILNSTINLKDLIKADALNNMALFAQQKMELSKLENKYKTLSSVVNNSVNSSVKEKIVALNLRLENFHTFTNEEFQEKLNLMEMERNSLLIKLMEKDKQDEIARRRYKNYLKQLKEDEKQSPNEKQKSRRVIYEDKTGKSKNHSKVSNRDIDIIDNRKARYTKKNKFYDDEEDYEDEDSDNDIKKRRYVTKIVKRPPQTTREVIKTGRRKNRRAYNADSEDDNENDDDNYKLEPRRVKRTKKKAQSPKPQNLKKILDEEVEERKKITKKRRSKSVTVTEKKEAYYDYDEYNNTSKTNNKSHPNSPQKRSKGSTQKTTKKRTTNKSKKV